MHDRLAHVVRERRTDHDVAKLARNAFPGGVRVGAVDGEGEHVGGPVFAAVLAVELGHALGAHELDGEMSVARPRPMRAQARTGAPPRH